MRTSVWKLGVGLGLLILGMGGSELRADLVRPPNRAVYAEYSEECEKFMSELHRAVAQKKDEVLKCLSPWAKGHIYIKCSFNAAGTATKCVPDVNPFSKRENACVQKALISIKLDPKSGDPRQCIATIEVRSESTRVRPYRKSKDPDDPLNGIE